MCFLFGFLLVVIKNVFFDVMVLMPITSNKCERDCTKYIVMICLLPKFILKTINQESIIRLAVYGNHNGSLFLQKPRFIFPKLTFIFQQLRFVLQKLIFPKPHFVVQNFRSRMNPCFCKMNPHFCKNKPMFLQKRT